MSSPVRQWRNLAIPTILPEKDVEVGARELALFQHLSVEGFRALDPGTQVYGGQRAWRAQWWPTPLAPDVPQ